MMCLNAPSGTGVSSPDFCPVFVFVLFLQSRKFFFTFVCDFMGSIRVSPRPVFGPLVWVPWWSSPPKPPAASSVIIGDSIVRNIKLHAAATSYAGKAVIHTGTNDISSQQSEVLKQDLTVFLNFLKTVESLFSGPLPSFHRGVGPFSRLLSLNMWLQSVCSVHNLVLIDHFNLFWERAAFFNRDGIDSSPQGSRALAANIRHAIVTIKHG
uniref:SGNH hydrolase-type esterase domain-containing protein n=1 Tax=Stegastes partitus TaxID=144197 RepID=A0A3B4ZJQ3_9TELE